MVRNNQRGKRYKEDRTPRKDLRKKRLNKKMRAKKLKRKLPFP